jgi:hypothetical protein
MEYSLRKPPLVREISNSVRKHDPELLPFSEKFRHPISAVLAWTNLVIDMQHSIGQVVGNHFGSSMPLDVLQRLYGVVR